MSIDDGVFRAIERFYGVVDTQVARLERDHEELICPSDCSICCVGNIFFITALDFAYVCRYAQEHLTAEDRDAVVAAAKTNVAECGEEVAERLEATDERAEAFPKQTCPLLEGGRCRIYPARPSACRLFGRTRYGSGKLNLCDVIYNRLPQGGNGNPREPFGIRFPVVEQYSKALAAQLQRELGRDRVDEVERLLNVSTIPVFIATTEFDENKVFLVGREC